MKLAAKLTLSLVGVALLALAAETWMEQRRRVDLLAMDVEKDWRFARILQANVETLWRENGPAVAQRLVESTDRAVPNRMIRFAWLTELPEDLRVELPAKRQREDLAWRYLPEPSSGSEMRYLYVPLAPDGVTQAAIVAGQSLELHDAYLRGLHLRRAATGVTLLGLGGLLSVILGARLVERPVESLKRSVRALGDGRPAPPVVLKGRDELAGLAQELNIVGERLVARERFQHAERLRTIGQLAAGVAHELGTPLSVIGVRARMIASGEVIGPEAQGNARVILDQSARMTAIVRQLLDYARRQGPQSTVVDLRHVVSGALAMLEPLAAETGVALDLVPADEPLPVRGDQTQLQQVVANLAMNGLQAMPHGGRLRVELGRGRPASPGPDGQTPDDCLWLRVRDDGPGIAPEHLPHVFEPFYTTKPVGEGTGLGLAVVQTILQSHGGWVTVENEVGHGACFTVHLMPARAEPALERLAS